MFTKVSTVVLMMLALGACGGQDAENISSLKRDANDKEMVDFHDKTKWYSKIFRVEKTGNLDGDKALDFLTLTQTTDLYVVYNKAGDVTTAHPFKLSCPSDPSAVNQMRFAIGDTKPSPAILTYEENENSVEYKELVALKEAVTSGKIVDLLCPVGTKSSDSVLMVTEVAVGSAPGTDLYIDLKQNDNVNAKFLLSNECEDPILTALGLGTKQTPADEDKFSKFSATKLSGFLKDASRIPLVCVEKRKFESLESLCSLASVGGTTTDAGSLYLGLRKAYNFNEPVPACDKFEKQVSDTVKAAKSLNLSKTSTGTALKIKDILQLNLFREGAVADDALHITKLNTLDLQGQNFTPEELNQLFSVIAKLYTGNTSALPLKINLLGSATYEDGSFLESIKNLKNLTVVFTSNAFGTASINCPVDGPSDSTVTLNCVKTVPFYRICTDYYKGVRNEETKSAEAYLKSYVTGFEISNPSVSVIQSSCANFVGGLVNKQAIALPNLGLTSLKTFNNLPNLKALILSGNTISASALQEIPSLPKLEELDLSNNGLSDLPKLDHKWIANLQSLNVAGNNLTSLASLEQFKGLSVLSVSRNTLTTAGLDKLSAELSYLDLSNTGIFEGRTADSSQLSRFTKVMILDLTATKLDMSVATFVEKLSGKFKELSGLMIGSNALTGNAVDLYKLNGPGDTNNYGAIVALDTKLVNAQSLNEETEEFNFYVLDEDSADYVISDLIEIVSNVVTRYILLYPDLNTVQPEFAKKFDAVTPNKESNIVTPRYFFGKNNVTCGATGLHPDIQNLCVN